jgi:hypothetical protein
MVDVINILNADTMLSVVSENVTASTFGTANSRFDPRRAMVGIRMEF